MNILFVASESNPFAKTGGLADVVYALAKEMVSNGEDVSIIMPFYQHLGNSQLKFEEATGFDVKMNWRSHHVTIMTTVTNGIKFYFVKCDTYFNRENLYSYDDDIERFSLFDMAVVEMIVNLGLTFDIVHVHDWQAGMVPLLLKNKKINSKTVMTIHNPAFQGNFSPDYLTDYLNLPRSYYDDGTVRFNDYCSFLKTGIMLSDCVTTVSITHAKELREDKTSFNGIGNIIELRGDKFIGIVNGMDNEVYNPATDGLISQKYDIYSFSEGKKKNLEVLKNEFSYDRMPKGLVCGVVSRLTSQKGIASIIQAIPALVTYDMQLFIIGEGERELENKLEKLADTFPNHVKFFKGFSNPLAHLVYASCDLFLMPSLYEPCGIGQLIAMRYGAIPVVTNVGGLNDTVVDYHKDPLHATGFAFDVNDEKGLVECCRLANALCKEDKLKPIIVSAMSYDSSWTKSGQEYLELYKSL